MDAIEHIRQWVRFLVRHVARALNAVSGGLITPNMVTWTGLAMHGFIAWLIVNNQWPAAASALIIFGLFDTLDGELARVQQKTSDFGMVLDSSTDRLKEALLYGGLGYWFAAEQDLVGLIAAFAVLGSSFAISYVKAKAETVIATKGSDSSQVNRHFNSGLARFEIRMFILVIGLYSAQVEPLLWLLLLLNTWTFFQRLFIVKKELS